MSANNYLDLVINISFCFRDKNGQPVARFGPTDDPIPKAEDACKKNSNHRHVINVALCLAKTFFPKQ